MIEMVSRSPQVGFSIVGIMCEVLPLFVAKLLTLSPPSARYVSAENVLLKVSIECTSAARKRGRLGRLALP